MEGHVTCWETPLHARSRKATNPAHHRLPQLQIQAPPTKVQQTWQQDAPERDQHLSKQHLSPQLHVPRSSPTATVRSSAPIQSIQLLSSPTWRFWVHQPLFGVPANCDVIKRRWDVQRWSYFAEFIFSTSISICILRVTAVFPEFHATERNGPPRMAGNRGVRVCTLFGWTFFGVLPGTGENGHAGPTRSQWIWSVPQSSTARGTQVTINTNCFCSETHWSNQRLERLFCCC